MPLIKYVDLPILRNIAHLKVVTQANNIIAEYRAQGFDLTLRQLYYQFVSRDLIPNNQREYKRLGSIINDARLVGLLDWSAIVDRTRNLQRLSTWDKPDDILDAVSRQYRRDLWASQANYVEVWIEKDALIGVIEGVCESLRVPFFSCRGYTSQSELWGAGQRLRDQLRDKKTPVVLHFGDHDPSGIDMTRDITDRLQLFCGRRIDVRRLALNQDQIEQYGPPPNPTKLTDSRSDGYVRQYGMESWELDALEPRVIAQLIRDEVATLLHKKKWSAALAVENTDKLNLADIAVNYDNIISDYLPNV